MCGGGGLNIIDVIDPFGTLHEGGVLTKPKTPKKPMLGKPTLISDADALIAAKKAKQVAAATAAYGTSDTYLTGGKGLGSASAENKAYTTLLGT